MSRNISLASVAEKNSLTSGTPFLICLKIDVISPATLSVVETLYLVKNTEDVTVDGQVCTAFPFEIKVQSSAGEIPTATITADDYSRAIQSRMQLYGGGVGFGVDIKVVNSSVNGVGYDGGNIVTGGSFDTQADVDLWEAYAVPFDVIELDAGRMKLYSVAVAGDQSLAKRTITGLTAGVTYDVTIDAEQGTGTGAMEIASNPGTGSVGRTTTGPLSLSFVANAATADIWLYNQNASADNHAVWFDNFSVTSAPTAGAAQVEVVDTEYFKVVGAAVKGNVVTWTLGDDNPLASPFPRRRQLMDRCSWRYKSGNCGYVGAMSSCDLTLNGSNGCAAHDNDLRFGGFPGINRGNSRFV